MAICIAISAIILKMAICIAINVFILKNEVFYNKKISQEIYPGLFFVK